MMAVATLARIPERFMANGRGSPRDGSTNSVPGDEFCARKRSLPRKPKPRFALAARDKRSTPPLVIAGRIGQADAAELRERMVLLLRSANRPLRVTCDVARLADSDLGTIDALAKLQLTARRLGGSICLRHASAQLQELLTLVGVGNIVQCDGDSGLEARRQPESGKEAAGVEEEGDPADPTG
jgi:ABC-type transporter Mla MlaB component